METNKETHELAVVTGASSGIGYELARIFAKNGFDLIVAAEDDGINTAAERFKEFGGNVQALQVDLAQPGGVEALYAAIQQSDKNLEAIAINAGVGVGGEFIKTDWDKELNMIQLNIISLTQLTKRVLPDLVTRGAGKILFTSSLAAEMPGPYYAIYAATKAYVQSFAEAIRYEVKDSGVTVTALQPGATDTNFFERAEMVDTKAGKSKKDSPADVAQDGYDAMMAGKDHVVAGSFMNKVQSTVAKFVTEGVGAALQGDATKPESLNPTHH